MGGVQEVGGERAGGGIPKVAEPGEKEKKFAIFITFYNRNRTEAGPPTEGGGKWE